ncbi:GNAT family N-acetyltransferase [Paenibacillus sp. 1P07SE]|uniref:GNAT family N-acetyltransferase n=1 Tax=Paenibacillus sp. 1P07SE TaxID=3132209 RepID=UPI0039A6E975
MNLIEHRGYQIKLIDAPQSDKSVFRNLMQMYLYDTSEFNGKDPDKHGFFDYSELDHYWTEVGRTEEGRIPILIQINDKLAGFMLINRFSLLIPRDPATRNLADFFIMRKWRGKRIGRVVVKEIFDMLPGHWEIRQEQENIKSQQFWRTVIGEYTNESYKETILSDDRWQGPVQQFSNATRIT